MSSILHFFRLQGSLIQQADLHCSTAPRPSAAVYIPKGPCTHIVYIWALKLRYGNPFKAPSILYRYMDPLGIGLLGKAFPKES